VSSYRGGGGIAAEASNSLPGERLFIHNTRDAARPEISGEGPLFEENDQNKFKNGEAQRHFFNFI
jgi:hypothetical protein